MESNSCAIRWGNDIKQEKTGIKMMNTLKKAAIGAGIVLASAFAAKDAVSQDIVASNSNTPAKTSLTSNFSATEKEPKKPAAIIKEGHGGDAQVHSLRHKDIFVLSIYGGTKGINGEPQEAYTAKVYAELLQKEFAKYGEDVAVFYTETGREIPTVTQVLKAGQTFDRVQKQFINSSSPNSFFHPFILHGAIKGIVGDNNRDNVLAAAHD